MLRAFSAYGTSLCLTAAGAAKRSRREMQSRLESIPLSPLEEKARELTTWISEEGPDTDLGQARRVAEYFAMKGEQAETIISEVAAALHGWQNTARRLGMSAADIAVYATAFVIEN